MKKIILGSISVMLFCNVSFGQQDSLQNDLQKNDSLLIDSVLVKNTWNDNPVYKINPAVDIPLSAAGAGFSYMLLQKFIAKTPQHMRRLTL
jgi:hypothetical protein